MPGVELVGVHAHIGSQVFEASSFEQAAEVLGAFFAPLGLPELVVGGGLGVPYVNGESAPSQPEWADGHPSRVRRGGRRSAARIIGRARPFHCRHRRDHPLHRGHGQAPARASGPT